MNIMNGFKKNSIFPYNHNLFKDDEFSPSFVTKRPEPASIDLTTTQPIHTDPVPSTSTSQRESEPSTSNKENEYLDSPQTDRFSLENVRPYPKATPRKISTNTRGKRKAAILTDTPDKNALQEEEPNKCSNKVKNQRMNIEKKRKKSVSKKILQSSDESNTDECICLVCGEVWSESSNQEWIQCEDCKEWAHKKCVQVTGLHFICINCNSDDDDDEF